MKFIIENSVPIKTIIDYEKRQSPSERIKFDNAKTSLNMFEIREPLDQNQSLETQFSIPYNHNRLDKLQLKSSKLNNFDANEENQDQIFNIPSNQLPLQYSNTQSALNIYSLPQEKYSSIQQQQKQLQLLPSNRAQIPQQLYTPSSIDAQILTPANGNAHLLAPSQSGNPFIDIIYNLAEQVPHIAPESTISSPNSKSFINMSNLIQTNLLVPTTKLQTLDKTFSLNDYNIQKFPNFKNPIKTLNWHEDQSFLHNKETPANPLIEPSLIQQNSANTIIGAPLSDSDLKVFDTLSKFSDKFESKTITECTSFETTTQLIECMDIEHTPFQYTFQQIKRANPTQCTFDKSEINNCRLDFFF